MRDMKRRHQITGVENARHEKAEPNNGVENARKAAMERLHDLR